MKNNEGKKRGREEEIGNPKSPVLRPGPGSAACGASLLIMVAAGMLYLGFLSSRYNFDGTLYALRVGQAAHSGETGGLWHPQHLLYGPLSYIFYRTLLRLGLELPALLALQLMDVLFASLTLGLFQLFCFRLTRDRFIAVSITLLLGFSFGFWFFALEPEMHAMNTFFLFVCFFLLWRGTGQRRDEGWVWRAAGFGVLAALAMANHLVNGLFLIPAAVAAVCYTRGEEKTSPAERLVAGLPPALVMLITALLLISLLLGLGYEVNPMARGKSIAQWVMGLADPDTGLGYRKSYWALHPRAFFIGLRGFYHDFLAEEALRGAEYNWLKPLRAIFIIGLLSVLCLYLAFLPRFLREQPRVHLLLLLCLVPLVIFSFIWEPHNFEMKVSLLPLLWLAAGLVLARLKQRFQKKALVRPLQTAVAACTCSLFLHNFFGSVLPGSDPQNNRNLQRAYFVRDHTEHGAVVYLAGVGEFSVGKVYLIHFAGRETRVVDWIIGRDARPFPESVAASLAADAGRPAYILSELLEPGPALEALARNHGLAPEDVSGFFRSLNLARAGKMDDGFGLYRIAP